MTEQQTTIDTASRLGQKIRLMAVSFVALEAKLLGEPLPPGAALSYTVNKCDGRWIRDETSLHIILPYSIDVGARAGASSANLAFVQVVVRVSYQLGPTTFTDDELQAFAAITPFMHSWPYLRAQVQDLTTRIGLPPLMLPMVVSGNAEQLVSMRRLTEDELAGSATRPASEPAR